MRKFVVIGHKTSTSADFTLDDLCGSAGRLDVLIRSINSSLMLSHGIRRDSEIYLVLLGKPMAPKTIRISGEKVRYLNPDERSTGSLIRQALSKGHLVAKDGGEVETTPGIFLSNRGLSDVLDELSKDTQIFCLDENGDDIEKAPLVSDITFVLSDHKDFSEDETSLMNTMVKGSVSLGPSIVHTHHAITIVHNQLDRRGL